MHDRELARLLGGATGAVLALAGPDGPVEVYFTRHDLRTPAAWRAALRRQLGHLGYQPPVYGLEHHDQIIRACFRLADAEASVS